MSLIVQKFGGTSVADADRIRNVARIITETYRKGHSVVAVLSAQGDTTDDLIEKAKEINPSASKREMDMLLATGEQISISLCAMAIERMGYQAVSLTGWQAGMLTDSSYSSARIKRIRTERIQKELDKKKIVLVAGFQGINKYDDITTLGRGGSDTSAVALAAAACLMLTLCVGTAAASPGLRRQVGGLSEYAADQFQPVNKTSTDQGLRMEVLAAANDGDRAVTYLNVQDAQWLRCFNYGNLLYDYAVSSAGRRQGMAFSEVVAYDEASQTATLRLESMAEDDGDPGRRMRVQVAGLLTGAASTEWQGTG